MINNNHTWAHQLVNLHYSDDETDYPVDFRFWEQADLEAVEGALREMGCQFTEEKLQLKTENPKRWRRYLLKRYDRKRVEPLKGTTLKKVHRSKIDLGMELLGAFFSQYPHIDLPVAFDGAYTCGEFCSYIDKVLHKKYVGSVFKDNSILRGTVEISLETLTEELKGRTLPAH